MKLGVYNLTGEEIKKIEVNDNLFNIKNNPDLIWQAVYVYRSNARESNADTKTRGEIRGGGRKPWPQKHTGRARASSIRSPLWRGGGTVFGPTNEKIYKRKLNKKAKKKALFIILSQKLKDKQLILLDNINIEDKKTSKIQDLINQLGSCFFKEDKKPTYLFILDDQKYLEYKKYFSNISNVDVTSFKNINSYKLLEKKYIIIEHLTIKTLEDYYGKAIKKQE